MIQNDFQILQFMRASTMKNVSLVLAVALATSLSGPPAAAAFQISSGASRVNDRPSPLCLSSEGDQAGEPETYDTRAMELFLSQKYPAFMQLLSNQQIWTDLRNGDGGYTIFAPNNAAFDDMGEKKLMQLRDPRNLEATEKIAQYHAIASPVTSKEIFDSSTGGVITLGGEVPIGKTKTGGFLGWGGKEDGGVTVNGANIVESFEVRSCIVHEVDALVSPQLLWRYMDQLRLPGTQ
jgi:uncharacterized surface protein with fasciclin (FAS1) repeats